MYTSKFPFCNLSNLHVQIAEPAVAQYCKEAEQLLLESRYVDLANLLLTSADLVLANASEKGMSPPYKISSCIADDLIMFQTWKIRKVNVSDEYEICTESIQPEFYLGSCLSA